MPKFSVVIPAYRPDTLSTPIESVIDQTFSDWELLIVGQGNMKKKRVSGVYRLTQEYAQADSRIRYVHSDDVGHSRVVNVGIRSARSEIVSLLDDDCEAQADWLAVQEKYYERYPQIKLLGGSVIPPQKEKWLGVCPHVLPGEVIYDPVASNYVNPPKFNWIGANVSFNRKTALETGPFDHYLGSGTIFPAAGETDYMLRLEKRGVKMMTTPKMVVLHKYGYRYGLKAIKNHTYNYAYGNGGLAGKLHLSGDPKGEIWKRWTIKDRLWSWLKPFSPHRLLFDLLRLYDFLRAYRHCLKDYRVKDDLLRPVNS